MTATIPSSVYIIDYNLRVIESAVSMGQSLSEIEQFVSGPGGPWAGTLTVRVPRDAYNDWQAFLDQRRGPNRPFTYYPGLRHPRFSLPSEGNAVIGLSGSDPVFGSGSEIASAAPVTAKPATQYARFLEIAHPGNGLNWKLGTMFNVMRHAYRVVDIVNQTTGSVTVEVIPRIRVPVPIFAPITPAAINMRLASRESGRIQSPIGAADASLEILEFFG